MTPPNWSYWEHKHYFSSLDYLIVGAGIVGKSCAYHLKKKFPNAKILIVERDIISAAASTKNAGFACFGSPSELLEDLNKMPEEKVWSTVQRRWNGLQALQNWLGANNIDLQTNGSWDLFVEKSKNQAQACLDRLEQLNKSLYEITGKKQTFIPDHSSIDRFGMTGFQWAIKNQLEGQIDTSKLHASMKRKMYQSDILELNGIEIQSFTESGSTVHIQSNIGELHARNLVICSNGFSKTLLPELDIEPARAQVLITEPMDHLSIRGTFHVEGGFYYFRNIDNRILLGGGRNLDLQRENTAEFGQTELIMNRLRQMLREQILPNQSVKIERTWSGIMGVGRDKQPIVQRLSPHITCGIKMGGMGIAIGTQIGIELAELHS